jgi:hypothetical protein
MAVKPRVSVGAVDLGDVKEIIEEVVQENEDLYDRTFATMIDAFTEPLSPQEIQDILARLDLATLASMIAVDPEGARVLLRQAREGAS